MRTINAADSAGSQLPVTISDLEHILEKALESLRPAPLSEDITAAFPYLLPKGMRVRVQLEEDGRKKRSTAAASNWNPQTGEIVVYYEPVDVESEQSLPAKVVAPSISTPKPLPVEAAQIAQTGFGALSSVKLPESVTPLEIQQCCEALAEAEKVGKLFIAFRWFRDEDLPRHKFEWIKSEDRRQRVLAKAIEVGAIQTQRIPNPKSPQHPTTTVKLNRAQAPQAVSKRFNPIAVRGEPVSVTIMRDRGTV